MAMALHAEKLQQQRHFTTQFNSHVNKLLHGIAKII
jgi:hypothetical protein